MSRQEFERAVSLALDEIPPEFSELLENVAVVVEDEPTSEDLVEAGLDPETETLFGLYQGLSLPERGVDWDGLPDRIVVYRRPLLEACADRAELLREIRDTVIHEIGHFFGLGEDDLP